MAAVSVGIAEGPGAHVLGDALQQVLQKVQSIQEALLAQEGRLEALEWTRQGDGQAAVACANEGAPTPSLEERILRIEQRMEELERRSLTSGEQERSQASAVGERLAHLESGMEQLDASTERALQAVVPRVDALLNQLGIPSAPAVSPRPSISPASTSTSGAVSSAPRPRSPSGSAAPPPLTPERQRELGEALLDAVWHRKEATVRKMLKRGADVNFSNDGQTPLQLASERPLVQIISLLVEKGADVSVRDAWGETVLHSVAVNDKVGKCVRVLVDAGVPVDSRNRLGETALHLAALEKNEGAVRALLEAGASKSVRDNKGRTPLERARVGTLETLLRP